MAGRIASVSRFNATRSIKGHSRVLELVTPQGLTAMDRRVLDWTFALRQPTRVRVAAERVECATLLIPGKDSAHG